MSTLKTGLSLAPIFSDNMILQRDKEFKVWGKSTETYPIMITLGAEQVTVYPVEGRWQAVLPPMKAAESEEMTIYSVGSSEKIVVKNVAIGEVWIAGGQSNMEWFLRWDAEASKSIASANHPLIRYYETPKITYEGQDRDEDFSDSGFWRLCDPKDAPFFSAVGYYFAHELYNSLNVPIGIVGCNYGGSSASTWLEETYLENDEDLRSYLRDYEENKNKLSPDEYEAKFKKQRSMLTHPETNAFMEKLNSGELEHGEQVSKPADDEMEEFISLYSIMGPKSFNRPSGLYHTMVKTIAGYASRGVIWYQGESDVNKADIYDKLFASMIRCWRETWDDELLFFFVQLAPFTANQSSFDKMYPIIRQRQEQVSKTVPNAYMASIMDAGMEFDIHPRRKRPVGERLALLTRGKVYGENIICESPEVRHAVRKDLSVTVELNHVGTGLKLEGHTLNGLQVFIRDEEITDFNAEIGKDVLSITSEKFDQASRVQIRYAWKDYVEVNLYSSVGLPVKPFMIEI